MWKFRFFPKNFLTLITELFRNSRKQKLLKIPSNAGPYLKMPTLPKARMDVLAWWKVQEPVFPLLAEIARKYLCVPPSSAPSERLFSASGNICTRLRSSLVFSELFRDNFASSKIPFFLKNFQTSKTELFRNSRKQKVQKIPSNAGPYISACKYK